MLECLGGVLQAKGHIGKYEKAESGVVGVDRNLVVCPYKVNFGKGGAAGKAVGVVLHVWDCVPARDGASVESSVVSTGSPTAILVGY
jgi:hypothetical protein